MNWQAFHFLRPEWFWAFLPVALIIWALLNRLGRHNVMDKLCDPALLQHLWIEPPGKLGRGALVLLLLGWILVIVALAGPVWERQPQPVFRAETARVIVLDLSASMDVNDLSPSRLERSRYKLADILDRSVEGRTGLVVFSAEAHIVTPLTSDTATISTMIPALQTSIMPAAGDHAASGLRLAQALIERAMAKDAEVLLLTDGIADPADALQAAVELKNAGISLSIIGTATAEGAPLPDGQGGFRGMAQIDQGFMQSLAKAGGGRFMLMQHDDDDLNYVLNPLAEASDLTAMDTDAQVERWKERGVWLLPLILVFAASGFRRGWLGVVMVLVVLPPPSYAMGWDDLWFRQDQQGLRSLNTGDAKQAATQFVDPAWRGAALYQSGDYAESAVALEGLEDDISRYNRATALARAGQLDDSIALYQSILESNPQHADAAHNLEIVKAQKQQKEQPEQDESQGNEDNQPQSKQNPEGENSPEDNADAKPQTPPQPESPEPEASQQDEGEEAQPPEAQPTEDESPPQQETPSEQSDASPPDPQDERLLRQVPDDPAALLRNKFMLEHLRRQQQGQK